MTELYTKKCALLIETALSFVGKTEKGGDNCGPEVELFQKAVDGKAQRESWCLAFVQYCVKRTDVLYETKNGGPNPASWLYQTEHCMTLWNHMLENARIQSLLHPGALILWQYYKDGKATASGHVGIIKRLIDAHSIETIEGNTGQGTAVEREGDGVYIKTRRVLTPNGSMRVKGFLQVWDPKL